MDILSEISWTVINHSGTPFDFVLSVGIRNIVEFPKSQLGVILSRKFDKLIDFDNEMMESIYIVIDFWDGDSQGEPFLAVLGLFGGIRWFLCSFGISGLILETELSHVICVAWFFSSVHGFVVVIVGVGFGRRAHLLHGLVGGGSSCTWHDTEGYVEVLKAIFEEETVESDQMKL